MSVDAAHSFIVLDACCFDPHEFGAHRRTPSSAAGESAPPPPRSSSKASRRAAHSGGVASSSSDGGVSESDDDGDGDCALAWGVDLAMCKAMLEMGLPTAFGGGGRSVGRRPPRKQAASRRVGAECDYVEPVCEPAPVAEAVYIDAPPPAVWHAGWDAQHGAFYYFCESTGVNQWDPPPAGSSLVWWTGDGTHAATQESVAAPEDIAPPLSGVPAPEGTHTRFFEEEAEGPASGEPAGPNGAGGDEGGAAAADGCTGLHGGDVDSAAPSTSLPAEQTGRPVVRGRKWDGFTPRTVGRLSFVAP